MSTRPTGEAMGAALAAAAKGSYPDEAAVMLLEGSGLRPRVEHLAEVEGDRAWFDWTALLIATGALSGGERRILAVCASLAGGVRIDLADAVCGLDRASVALVLAAVAHAAGTHEHSEFTLNPHGIPTLPVRRLGTLYDWPESVKRG